jgi:23S rRNA-/tRNA-specific pseudouridylate synthase
MGCPILGDEKYSLTAQAGNQQSLPDKSIGLCATAIKFKTATDNKEVNLEIQIPESWGNYI